MLLLLGLVVGLQFVLLRGQIFVIAVQVLDRLDHDGGGHIGIVGRTSSKLKVVQVGVVLHGGIVTMSAPVDAVEAVVAIVGIGRHGQMGELLRTGLDGQWLLLYSLFPNAKFLKLL
jgi:hypothetical protein